MKPFVSLNRLNSALWGELIILLHREIFFMQLPAPQQVPVVENSLIIHCPPDCAVLNTIPSYSPPSDPSSCFFSAIRFVRRLRSTFRITTAMTTIRRINTQAVITSAFFSSAVKSIPAAFTPSDSVQLLGFVSVTYPRLKPYMRFLFVRPEVCPSGDLSTPKIRLSSDSVSRRTPLPLARPSRCRAASSLSPYKTCAHRAHEK